MERALLFAVLATLARCTPRLDPLVATKRGLIRGLQASDGDYAMFLGIPYAKVNKTNPFGPSAPHPGFEGTYDAFEESAPCPQVQQFEREATGGLDCLSLNVYAPNKASARAPLPVLVWIYGGRFQYGSAGRRVYGPRYLVRNDVVLVTLNYRVGPYGFMCLDTAAVAGNQGLKDQLGALRWIKENIGAFGGDGDKVTIFGSSAGGVSVDFHLMSEKERLFDKVIMQSGTSLCPWTVEESDRNAPMILARHLGFEAVDAEEAVAFLSAIEPELVIGSAKELGLLFKPCVEKDFEGVEKFLGEHPLNSAIPKAKSIPILTGHNNREMLVLYGDGMHGNHSLDLFRVNMELSFDLSEREDLVTLARQFYVGDEDGSADSKWDLMDFESDFTFNHPMHRAVRKSLANGAKVYHYVFSYAGGRNMVKWQRNVTDDGAAHSDEKGYLFDVSFLDEPTEEDQLIIDRITTLWTNFVKYGDPTPATSDLLPVKWSPAQVGALTYLEIGSELAVKRSPFHRRMAFWDLFYRTNGHLLKHYDGSVDKSFY